MITYLPLATTLLAVCFAAALLFRWWGRRTATHLLWWSIGVGCYGLGTALESAITLGGNSIARDKAWYIAGAILGAWPLSQGTVYLLLSRRAARLLAWSALPWVVTASILVVLSPVDAMRLAPDRPSAALLTWPPARFLPIVINSYAALLLVGGAALSALRFARRHDGAQRAAGNALIALGALLPAIGGARARQGGVEALYVTELAGLLLIGAGYVLCVRGPEPKPPEIDERSGRA